jgi:hypothetical protein
MRSMTGNRISRAHLFEVEGSTRKENGVLRVTPLFITSNRFTAEGRAEEAVTSGACDKAKVYAVMGEEKKLLRQFPEEANL